MRMMKCDEMAEETSLAERFESQRGHLRAVAYRMLGSVAEAEDAVQECWLRLAKSDSGDVENLPAWLTTVVSRVCLDMLRSRKSRREEPAPPDFHAVRDHRIDPETEAAMAQSAGVALLVVLERLTPPERLAFVLHDLFDVPFEQIASIVERTPEAARQLASRARKRVHGAPTGSADQVKEHRHLVASFLSALQHGDVAGLISLLAPDIVFRADSHSAFGGQAVEVHGAANWAPQAVRFSQLARDIYFVLVEGNIGLILAPRGHLQRIVQISIADGKVSGVDVVGDPERLRQVELSVLDD